MMAEVGPPENKVESTAHQRGCSNIGNTCGFNTLCLKHSCVYLWYMSTMGKNKRMDSYILGVDCYISDHHPHNHHHHQALQCQKLPPLIITILLHIGMNHNPHDPFRSSHATSAARLSQKSLPLVFTSRSTTIPSSAAYAPGFYFIYIWSHLNFEMYFDYMGPNRKFDNFLGAIKI